MAQDDRKGKPPVTPGKSPAPTAPDTPASHAINAPPPPEAQDAAEAPPTPEPTVEEAGAGGQAMAGDGTSDPGSGEEGDVQPETETERLLREVEEAKQALAAKKETLARHEAQSKADEAAAAMVSGYAAEVPALKAHEQGLQQYQAAAKSFLNAILPGPTRDAIADVHKAPRKAIDDLRTGIDRQEGEAADARRDLADARAAAAAAKEKADALERPAASIKDRLKEADAVRSDAKKASAAGNYALAYWLIMDGGKLDKSIEGDPEIIAPDTLAAAIKKAAADQAQADKAVADLESRVEALDASLQKDKTQLATLQRTLDATILTALAKLNPPSAEAA